MNSEKDPKEYFEKWQKIQLSDVSRERMKKNLLEYARFHRVSETERTGMESRSIERVPLRTLWFTNIRIRTMPTLALAAVLILGGGASFAAQGSIPGDLLYPVKVSFNENIRSSLAFGTDAKARLNAELLEERLEEAEKLDAQGRLEGKLAMELETRIERHALAADASRDEESSIAAKSNSRVQVALDRFNALLNGGGSLAIGDNTRMTMEAYESTETSLDMGMSTMLAQEELPLTELTAMTERQIGALVKVLTHNRSEIRADLYTEYKATLDEASKLMEKAKTEREAQARSTITAAADLAGKVEAGLSLLGQVIIDPETGVITDIDFSVPPPLEINENTGAGIDGGIEVDISDDMIELRGDAGAGASGLGI